MKCFFFVLLTAFSYVNWHAQDTDQAKIAGVITQLKKNEYGAVTGVKFSDDAKAATEMAREAVLVDDPEISERIMRFAMRLEENRNYSNEKGYQWSSNLAFAEAAIAYMHQDVSYYQRSEVAGKLLLLYKPADLGKYATQIEGAVKASSVSMEGVPSRLLMLYGVLPSTHLSDVIPYVPKEAGPYDHGQFMYDAVLARLGDAGAQKRLMDFAVSLKRTGGAAWEALESALAYADSKEMKLFLARNLRCEEYGEMTGNASFPKRWTYAQALIKMMRDTPAFPIRYGAKNLKLEDDTTWDSMEAWCTAHLGVKYPNEPRKQMNIRYQTCPK
jgi:hypothetical protein